MAAVLFIHLSTIHSVLKVRDRHVKLRREQHFGNDVPLAINAMGCFLIPSFSKGSVHVISTAIRTCMFSVAFFFFTVGALCLIPTKCKGFFKESLTPKEGQHLRRPFSYYLLYCHTCRSLGEGNSARRDALLSGQRNR